MSNGATTWNVSYSRISWLEGVLAAHKNVTHFSRHSDIVFNLDRKAGRALSLLCLDEYVLGVAGVQRALREFSDVNIIFIGGAWNKYTLEAKRYCLQARVGLYNSKELNGALWNDEYWTYCSVDRDGDPVYQLGTERQ